MGFFDFFTGAGAKRNAENAASANRAQLNAGYTAQNDIYGRGYSQAQNYLSPYMQGGQQAYGAYQNMLGLNGAGAQQGAMSAYKAASPYLAAEQDRMTQAMDRRAAATGQFGGGMNALAKARALDESGYRNYSDYMNRLQGLSSSGQQMAGMGAGLAMQNAGNLAGVDQWYRGGNMSNETNLQNARSAASQAGMQNLIGLGGLAVSAFGGMPMSFGGGGSMTPGTMANGGWSTTVRPAGNNFLSYFGR